jgi:WD40 repeat protein
VRTIYLQGSLTMSGRNALRGRKLADRLRDVSDDFLLGSLIMTQERAATSPPIIQDDIISEVQLLQLAPDVIVMEGGLIAGGADGAWRIDRKLAMDFVNGGGTLIVADVDLNRLRDQRAKYADAATFLGASASYRRRDPVVGYDEQHFWRGTKQIICRFDDMTLADWLRPVYDGIPEILCGLPVRLSSWGDILASGNRSSTWSDATDGLPGPDNLPFASVHKDGQGFVVLICANVAGDAWTEGCRFNTPWLVNIAQFLSDRTRVERQRAGSALKSTQSIFLSYGTPNKDRVVDLYTRLTHEHQVGAWLDRQQLLVGDELPERIENAIRAATYFVVCWSAAAAKSEWVPRELEIAQSRQGLTIMIARLDDEPLPQSLANLLRIEAADMDAAELAQQISTAIERLERRARIEAARSRGNAALDEKAKAEQSSSVHEPGTSLTGSGQSGQAAPVAFTARSGLASPAPIATIRSSSWLHLLSFVDDGTLLSGSGNFDPADVASAIDAGVMADLGQLSVQTGTDGHFDDHVSTRRHLVLTAHGVQIFDRAENRVAASIECDTSAFVIGAAWHPNGQRIIVCSTNYVTIADDQGTTVTQRNVWEHRDSYHPTSVVWQPSVNPVYATDTRVCVADPDGRVFHYLTALDSLVVAVAVSPCGRFIAASALNGDIAVWSERGELLGMAKGIESGGWHPARCLAFSCDSRFLAQAGSTHGDELCVLELASGRLARVEAPHTDIVAFHPRQAHILATRGEKRINFWRIG